MALTLVIFGLILALLDMNYKLKWQKKQTQNYDQYLETQREETELYKELLDAAIKQNEMFSYYYIFNCLRIINL